MISITTHKMIGDLTASLLGPWASSREQFVLTHSLQLLVQLAKSESRTVRQQRTEKTSKTKFAVAARRKARLVLRKAAMKKIA